MSDLIERLRDRDAVVLNGLFHAIPAMNEAADEIERLRATQERMWCTACGTVTLENLCDCNRWGGETAREPSFINYADAIEAKLERAAKALEKIADTEPGTRDTQFRYDTFVKAKNIARAAIAEINGSGK